MPSRWCVNCRGGFKKGVKYLFKCPLYFEVVLQGAFLGSLSNLMMVNLPNYFYKCSLLTTMPSYCAVALVGKFLQYRLSYRSKR